MQDVYLHAWTLQPARAFGVDLKPLTLGHCYVFACLNTSFPFIDPEYRLSLNDCGIVLFVCRSAWQDSLAQLIEGNVDVLMKDMRDLAKKWARKHNTICDINAEANIVEAYLREYATMPRRVATGSSSRFPLRSHWTFAMAWRLMKRMSESDAWGMPLSRVTAYLSADDALNNDESLVSEKQEQMLDFQERMNNGTLTESERAWLAERKKGGRQNG